MKITLFVLSLCLGLAACQKEVVPVVALNQMLPATVNAEKPTATGTFVSGVHTTTGTVKLVIDDKDATKKYLVFENFKTDAGPDLRLYLAEDLKANGAIEVSATVNSGNFSVLIPTTANLDKQKSVLIWCKQFSVLFGSASLK